MGGQEKENGWLCIVWVRICGWTINCERYRWRGMRERVKKGGVSYSFIFWFFCKVDDGTGFFLVYQLQSINHG